MSDKPLYVVNSVLKNEDGDEIIEVTHTGHSLQSAMAAAGAWARGRLREHPGYHVTSVPRTTR